MHIDQFYFALVPNSRLMFYIRFYPICRKKSRAPVGPSARPCPRSRDRGCGGAWCRAPGPSSCGTRSASERSTPLGKGGMAAQARCRTHGTTHTNQKPGAWLGARGTTTVLAFNMRHGKLVQNWRRNEYDRVLVFGWCLIRETQTVFARHSLNSNQLIFSAISPQLLE